MHISNFSQFLCTTDTLQTMACRVVKMPALEIQLTQQADNDPTERSGPVYNTSSLTVDSIDVLSGGVA